MYTKRQLSILALILGTIGLCLFLLEKMDIVKTKVVNYIGKALIAIGIYLLAIANIITDEGLTLLSETDGNLSIVDTSGLSGQIKTTSTAPNSISTAGGINAPGGITTGGINAGPITADTLKINSNVGFFGTDPVGQQQFPSMVSDVSVFKHVDDLKTSPYRGVGATGPYASRNDCDFNFYLMGSKVNFIENALINYGLLKRNIT